MRTTLAIALMLATAPAHTQDASLGQRVFTQCRPCHQVGETARNGIGPTLNGLFGRKAGTIPAYAYSEANKSADITWDEATFTTYIHDPKARMPGTKMAFAGLRDDKQVADLVAYLKQYGTDGKPPQ